MYKDRLRPGRMLLVDTEEGRIMSDEEVKSGNRSASIRTANGSMSIWLVLEDLPDAPELPDPDHDTVLQRQQAFGYTFEELRKVLEPMAEAGVEPIGSMGYDAPLAVLVRTSAASV